MIYKIQSFVGTSVKCYRDAVKEASDTADCWMDKLIATWDEVKLASMSTQCLNDEYTYIITMAVTCENFTCEEKS